MPKNKKPMSWELLRKYTHPNDRVLVVGPNLPFVDPSALYMLHRMRPQKLSKRGSGTSKLSQGKLMFLDAQAFFVSYPDKRRAASKIRHTYPKNVLKYVGSGDLVRFKEKVGVLSKTLKVASPEYFLGNFIGELPIKSGSVDTIVDHLTLQYHSGGNVDAIAREYARVLKSGGKALITFRMRPEYGFRMVSPDEVAEKFRDVGCTTELQNVLDIYKFPKGWNVKEAKNTVGYFEQLHARGFTYSDNTGVIEHIRRTHDKEYDTITLIARKPKRKSRK